MHISTVSGEFRQQILDTMGTIIMRQARLDLDWLVDIEHLALLVVGFKVVIGDSLSELVQVER